MNLVFLNSLERRADDRLQTAQVSIAEEMGQWRVWWNEMNDDGMTEQDDWYAGHEWQDMLGVFRAKLMEKRAEGYRPLIGPVFEGQSRVTGKYRYNLMLQFYGETHSNEDLYELLRKWRLEQATSQGKTPYFVASNKLLHMFSAYVPHTEDELKQIPGFGENRIRQYGASLLEVLSAVPRDVSFPLDWVASKVDETQFEAWLEELQVKKYRFEQDRLAENRAILQGISDNKPIDELRQTVRMPRKDLVQRLEQLDADGYEFDLWLAEQLKSVDQAALDTAWKAFEALGDRYLKPVFQKVGIESEPEKVYEWLRLLRIRFRKSRELAKQVS